MSKAFTKETDQDDDDDKPEIKIGNDKNYVTPYGLAQLQEEYQQLRFDERPKLVETVRWAAGNGDRSENGDYIYGKKRLREIDRRVRYLLKRIESAQVVDPNLQRNLTKVFFGATVTYQQKDGQIKKIKIVGVDEADLKLNKISWTSPVAKALLKAEVGDIVTLRTPSGQDKLEVLTIEYCV